MCDKQGSAAEAAWTDLPKWAAVVRLYAFGLVAAQIITGLFIPLGSCWSYTNTTNVDIQRQHDHGLQV